MVVLGAYAPEISEQHQHAGISYIINESWEEGMSSSISAGLTNLLAQDNTLQQLIIAVSDQPFISSEIFENLIKKQKQTGKFMVASSYAQTVGSPALFNRKYFDELLSLSGNEGAKHLLKQYPEDRETISFELGHIDIDTETDYNHLINYR
ncbi:MobA-like NTP transferase domain protein [compost metagenome]